MPDFTHEEQNELRAQFWDDYKHVDEISSLALRKEPGTGVWWWDVGVTEINGDVIDAFPDDYEEIPVFLKIQPFGRTAILTPEDALIQRQEVLEQAAGKLMDQVNAVRVVAGDLQQALALIAKYQNVIERLYAPDPNINEANPLLKKYGVTPGERSKFFAVLVDGLDITDVSELLDMESIFDHPIFDVDGTVAEDQGELPAPPKQLEA